MGYETSHRARMWRGLFVGAGSALVLSVLLVGAVSLLAPAPTGRGGGVPSASDTPAAPQMDTVADSAPVAPEPLPLGVETLAAQTEAAAVEQVDSALALPAGSQFNLPPEDVEPVVPSGDTSLRAGPVGAATRLDLGMPARAPSPDTSSAALPAPGLAIATVSAPPADVAPTRPAVVSDGAPQTFRDVEVVEAASDLSALSPVTDTSIPSPEESPEPEAIAAVEVVAEPVEETAPPVIVAEVAPEAPSAPASEIAVESLTGGVSLVDEPLAVAPAERLPEPEPAPEIVPRRIVLDSARAAAEAEEAAEEETRRRAILANAEGFENPEGFPLFSIILIDDPSSGVSRTDLLAFGFPVTFAVDPTAPDAASTVQFYRDAGHEVLMLADGLPVQGAAQDIEVALAGALAEMPGVVGILDRTNRGFGTNRQALAALLPPMSDVGLGLVTYGTGLNSGLATAQRDGIPADQVYRTLDAGGERASVITRYLDRATFEAAQDGRAIVVGRTAPDTITALFSWALGRRSGTVAVAPVSHLLLSASGG